jgi:hypothetical protein
MKNSLLEYKYPVLFFNNWRKGLLFGNTESRAASCSPDSWRHERCYFYLLCVGCAHSAHAVTFLSQPSRAGGRWGVGCGDFQGSHFHPSSRASRLCHSRIINWLSWSFLSLDHSKWDAIGHIYVLLKTTISTVLITTVTALVKFTGNLYLHSLYVQYIEKLCLSSCYVLGLSGGLCFINRL